MAHSKVNTLFPVQAHETEMLHRNNKTEQFPHRMPESNIQYSLAGSISVTERSIEMESRSTVGIHWQTCDNLQSDRLSQNM